MKFFPSLVVPPKGRVGESLHVTSHENEASEMIKVDVCGERVVVFPVRQAVAGIFSCDQHPIASNQHLEALYLMPCR